MPIPQDHAYRVMSLISMTSQSLPCTCPARNAPLSVAASQHPGLALAPSITRDGHKPFVTGTFI